MRTTTTKSKASSNNATGQFSFSFFMALPRAFVAGMAIIRRLGKQNSKSILRSFNRRTVVFFHEWAKDCGNGAATTRVVCVGERRSLADSCTAKG
jgi:hypothetical protein